MYVHFVLFPEMTRKSRAITLSLSEVNKKRLEALSLDFGLTWGEKPNISKLVKAVAEQKLKLSKNFGWHSHLISALYKAFNHLKDEGELGEAEELALLLLERSELRDPLRSEINAWLNKIKKNDWRRCIERFIISQTAFKLCYLGPSETPHEYHIHHASLVRHEDRMYLDCWCEEVDESDEIEVLRHNRSLRLDRIPDESEIIRIDGPWRKSRDNIEVELHLFNRLAKTYRPKTNVDLKFEFSRTNPNIRVVVRSIESTFWFLREIRRYGPDCMIVRPVALRDSHIHSLQMSLKVYTESMG